MGEEQSQTAGNCTIGTSIAAQCMAPLREISDNEGWVWPVHIGLVEHLLASYLDQLFQNRPETEQPDIAEPTDGMGKIDVLGGGE